MDSTEASIELLIKQLNHYVEERVESLSIDEISSLSDQIPHYKTMLEFREIRDKFLMKFNDPCEIPEAHSYTEELLDHSIDDCDLSTDLDESLAKYFTKETNRMKRIRKTVLTRCLQPQFLSKIQDNLAYFEDSITKNVYACQEGLLRVQSKKNPDYQFKDLLLELSSTFVRQRRNAVLQTILLHARRFPLTKQENIFANMFQLTQKSIKNDQNDPVVPTLPTDFETLNNDLIRISNRLGMKDDLEVSDGQKLLYQSKKKFTELFNQLKYYELPVKSIHCKHLVMNPEPDELIHQSLITAIAEDTQLREYFDNIFVLPIEEVINRLDQDATSFNAITGNEARSRAFRHNHHPPKIPQHKIASWMLLRYAYIKFLATSVLSHINYFEYIHYQVHSGKTNIMHSTEFKSRKSKHFGEILDIYDEKGEAFLFQSAINDYKKLIQSLVQVGSYYISKYEEESRDQNDGKSGVIDRYAIMEQLLEYELKYLNAKRKYFQPLIDILEHKRKDKFIKILHNIHEARPRFNLSIYQSYHCAYKLAIDLLNKKADIIRTIFNLQIMHERTIANSCDASIPLFDRPSVINTQMTYRSFDESYPISPFEVYESLSKIWKIIQVVPGLVKDIGESHDIKLLQYGEYLEYAVWMEIDDHVKNLVQNGYFPLDRSAIRFNFSLSDAVRSLFVSPYVNTFETIKDFIFTMDQKRILRFLRSARRFMHLSWKLQNLMIDADLLQAAYYTQCDQLGIQQKSILMSSFKDSAKNEILDLPSETQDINTLDFSLSEFEPITINFFDESSIKDIILASDFSIFKRIIQFQNLQNMIFEIAVRFNNHLIDSDFFVSYFQLGSTNQTTFLTGVTVNNDDDFNSIFFKQMIAYRIFYQSTVIFRDNQLARQNINNFRLSIRLLKERTRTILSAQVKQKDKITDEEMFELYLSELIDSFSHFAYRIEIARICNLERQMLLTNSFVDTYVLGPDPSYSLLNNNGQFEKFFYCPTWEESFSMMSQSPAARQRMVLKGTLQFVKSRYRILNLARYECALGQRLLTVFQSLYNHTFQCETPIFQKLCSEFEILDNAKEVEIATKYITEKEKFLFHRLEYSIINCLELFFISMNLFNNSQVTIADPHFGRNLQNIWVEMHNELGKEKWLITSSRYIPEWEILYGYQCVETDRAEIITRIAATDIFLDASVTSLYGKQVDNNKIKLLPLSIDFLNLIICQIHIKFAYFLLLEKVPEPKIDVRATVTMMTHEIYNRNQPTWDSVIVQQANEHLVPKDESPSKVVQVIPEPKLAQAIFDVVRNQVDLMLLTDQTQLIKTKITEFQDANKQLRDLVRSASKPVFQLDLFRSISKISFGPTEQLKTSHHYDIQFRNEIKYAHKRLVEDLGNQIQSLCVYDNDKMTVLDAPTIRDIFLSFSSVFNEFANQSLTIMNETWRKYIANVSVSLAFSKEQIESADILSRFSDSRFLNQTDSEVGKLFYTKFLELNRLIQQLKTDAQNKVKIEQRIEEKIREYYEKLIIDLQKSINSVIESKAAIKKEVFDRVLTRINRVKGFAIRFNNNPKELAQDISKEFGTRFDEEYIQKEKENNEQMRKEIILLRIFRCLNEKGSKLYYSRRIREVIDERKKNNEEMWRDKLIYEQEAEKSEEKLYKKHQEMSDYRLEIDKLKTELENQKMSNLQLVHYKANHLKTIDELKRQLDKYQGVGDVNINRLLNQLMEKEDELEQLRAVGDDLDSQFETSIKGSLKRVEQVRTAVAKSRSQRSRLMHSAMESREEMQTRDQYAKYIQQITKINADIQKQNDDLKQKIEDLEKQKSGKSEGAQLLMRETLHSKSPALRANSPNVRAKSKIATRKIVRPGLPISSRNNLPINRAVSRL